MIKRTLIVSALTALFLTTGFVSAADENQNQEKAQKQMKIYGSQMMTEEERNAYREKMRNAKTAQEQKQIRYEHHEQMKERAKERGITLPDEPPAMGGGMGAGSGMGGGMGNGGGRNR
jgi:hypothetical protein